MSLTGWLKSWVGDQHAPQRNEALVVAESLLMELDYQMREAEMALQERQQEEKRQKTGVDYSWLVNKQRKPYEIPQLERLELEELCLKVKPDESGRIIQSFRDSLTREPEIHEIPRMLKAVILSVLDGRPKAPESMPEWMMKSLTKLRPSTRVAPINFDCQGDLEMQPNGNNQFTGNETRVDTIDNLPV